MEEFYPMPLFVNLEVADLNSSADWYQMVLGFRVVFIGPPDNPTMMHLRRERFQDLLIHAAQNINKDNPGQGVLIQFQAGGSSVDEISRRARLLSNRDIEGPIERPWNVRDVTLSDPDGYRIRFSEPIDKGLSFKDVMELDNQD